MNHKPGINVVKCRVICERDWTSVDSPLHQRIFSEQKPSYFSDRAIMYQDTFEEDDLVAEVELVAQARYSEHPDFDDDFDAEGTFVYLYMKGTLSHLIFAFQSSRLDPATFTCPDSRWCSQLYPLLQPLYLGEQRLGSA